MDGTPFSRPFSNALRRCEPTSSEGSRPTRPIQKTTTGRWYRGLAVHAAGGLHGFVDRVVRAKAHRGAAVLELGAGSGALAQRLTDSGFRVDAVDLDGDTWGASLPLCLLDLNDAAWSEKLARTYPVVVAVEVIEHLENASSFFRGLYRACRAEGVCVLSTPNVVHPLSALTLLTRQGLVGFDARQIARSGHITLLPHWLLVHLARQAGFEVEELHFVGWSEAKGVKRAVMRLFLRWMLWRKQIPARAFQQDGTCCVLVLRKPAETSS